MQDGDGTQSSPGGTRSPRGTTAGAVPYLGVLEVTAESWKAVIDGSADGTPPPRIAGVFLLDRYAEGFHESLKASPHALEHEGKDLLGKKKM